MNRLRRFLQELVAMLIVGSLLTVFGGLILLSFASSLGFRWTL